MLRAPAVKAKASAARGGGLDSVSPLGPYTLYNMYCPKAQEH